MEAPGTVSLTLAILLTLHLHRRSSLLVWGAMDSCYDDDGRPSRCMPKFENAAFNRSVLVSNACGEPPEDYCMQTGSTRLCHRCDAADPERSHGARLLTDFHTDQEPTWWQSQSMFYGVQHPNSVNITLHLGKAFEITYVRLKFYTSRPESFAIYKRLEQGGAWLPYQYYSGSCLKTYGRDAKGYLRPGEDERGPACTEEFSDISPLTGGNVAFSTLEGRPSAYNFDQSVVLQEFVTATDLLISLDRLNTFGDEFFKDSKVLRSYFYAISDFSVGGRCKCNGHGSECVHDQSGVLACVCQHHTVGVDCQQCHPFYQDRPWARATGEAAHECLKCDCSGRSEECLFDMEQYRSSGHGGRCLNCRDNTQGPHCERCRENHYRASPQDPCLPCDCNVDGSEHLQCDVAGVCVCRATVTGAKCDTCQAGFHSLGPAGCRPCGCDARGSVGHCSLEDGGCYCKPNVEGQACDRCKPGFFHLQQASPAGCQACFCFGHSLACSASTQHGAINITSHFHQDQDGWLGEFSGGQQYPLLWKEGEVYLLPLDEHDTGFYKAPDKFLGNQINSYGHFIYFTFTSETPDLLPGRVAVLLEGGGVDGGALRLSADLPPLTPPSSSSSSSSLGRAPVHTFAVRLHEEEVFRPAVSSFQFRHLLHNLTAFKISNAGGHNYTSQLSGVRLASAAISSSSSSPPLAPAPWVEVCSCPRGFAGRLCESCAPGFTRETPRGGPLAPCVPCTCHQHGPCHPETGTCDCSDFTTGTTCEQCLEGYYGNALIGTPGDCRPCPCPDRTSCAQITQTGEVVCTNCPAGRTGVRCQKCEDGSHGDPLGQAGPVRACARCDCSGNVDPNAVGTCHHLTGLCLKCLHHTEGERCERCQPGFYGDALNHSMAQRCKSCSCSPAGTSGPGGQCHPQTGHCHCLPNVGGRDCSRCQVGFFHLRPGHGCQGCDCNSLGSSSTACHPITGTCMCRAGVEGRQCDSCRAGFFSFSSRGCRACNCDPMGSVSMQCHDNGTCHCRQGFMGYKCDKCQLNFYHNRATHHCEACPICYGLVKDKAETLGAQLAHLERLLARYDCRGRRLPPLQRSPADHQGEDALPNALEDILAFQEAREAFIQRFSALGASTHTLSAQLQGIATAMGCGAGGTAAQVTEEEEGVEVEERSRGGGVACQTLADSVVMVRASDERLKKATLDLNNMIIPFELATGPNKWNIMVNDSRALMKSHEDTADRVEGVAREALRASNRTLVMLLDLLQDNSTRAFIRGLEERLYAMQELKRNLTATANQAVANQLALGEESLALHIALGNMTSSIRQMALTDPGSDQTTNYSAEGLLNRTAELALHVQTKEELVNTIRTEMEPVIQAANRNLEKDFLGDIQEKKARIEGAKVIALTSVVSAKEMESQVITLHKEMETMERDWPRLQAQTRLAVKKERPLEEKVLADVRKKVKQVEKMLNPALGNTHLSNATAREALETATASANEAKDNVVQAKQTRSASRHLGTQVEATVQQLAQLENSSAIANTQLTSEPMNLKVVKEDMEAAKLQLELYASTLTELVSKIDGQVKLERFDRILNETALRLRMLRGSVESPMLGGKIQRLRSAAQEQQDRLASIEADLQEISQERDSLKDITLNLPKSCPQPTGAG